MGDIIAYTTSQLIDIQTKTWHNGCPEQVVTQNLSHTYRMTESNPKESRPWPTTGSGVAITKDKLWQYPTNAARQETKRLVYGIQRSPAQLGAGTDCHGSRSLYDIVNRQVVGDISLYAPFPISLDWQTKMRLDIKDVAVNLGTSVAEYRQTARMFKQFGIGVWDAWKLFRGKLPRKSKVTPCTASAAELVYSYGLEPLASDLFDSFWALQGRLVDPVYRRFISTAKDRGHEIIDNVGEHDVHWMMSERAIAYVELETNRQDFILGNPLEVAWEVVPFSFVVDWGFSVGDYLSSLDALKDVKSVTGSLTIKRKSVDNYTHVNAVDSGWTVEKPSKQYYNSHERQVILGIPTPQFPSWDPSKSWRAIMHGMSLLTQLSSKCRK